MSLGTVGDRSCDSTFCLSCQGMQSVSSVLLLSCIRLVIIICVIIVSGSCYGGIILGRCVGNDGSKGAREGWFQF